MNKAIIITKEMLLGARDYIPLEDKESWASENAPKCFNRIAIAMDDDPMPDMYAVNTERKSRFLMAALVGLYFQQKYESDTQDSILMSVGCYDAWAGSHVINQIERMKHDSDAEVRARAFDLMFDYKDFEKRFSAHIMNLLTVQNDFVLRQSQYATAQTQQLPQLLEQLKALQDAREGGNEDGETVS